MKYYLAIAALLGSTDATNLSRHKHHGPSVEKDLIQIRLESNQNLFDIVNQKISKISSLVEVRKLEESCDAECQKKCDADADKMIRELKNPLHDITWNCKNNYDVYTTDYDPEHSHFDRISMDVMATQRTINRIQELEKKVKKPGSWSWQNDETDTDQYVLKQLKKELGLDEDKPLPDDIGHMNVRSAVEKAVKEHAAKPGSPGYIKAHGLKEPY